MPTSPTVSLVTAAAITTVSKRTWWRRIEQGKVKSCATKPSVQARLLLSDVLADVSISVTPNDIDRILCADAGDADAQNDVGQMFLVAGNPKAALYWFQKSANQENPQSMQCLGQCYINGEGIYKNNYLGLMWIAKAASLGDVIAKTQIDDILQR